MKEPEQTDPSLVHAETIRAVAKDALNGVAGALYFAAFVLAVLMVVVWLRSTPDEYHEADFPGRYLFALLPLLAAAFSLQMKADEIGRGR